MIDVVNGISKGMRLVLDAIKEESNNSRQPMAEPSRQRGELSDSTANLDNGIEILKEYVEKYF